MKQNIKILKIIKKNNDVISIANSIIAFFYYKNSNININLDVCNKDLKEVLLDSNESTIEYNKNNKIIQSPYEDFLKENKLVVIGKDLFVINNKKFNLKTSNYLSKGENKVERFIGHLKFHKIEGIPFVNVFSDGYGIKGMIVQINKRPGFIWNIMIPNNGPMKVLLEDWNAKDELIVQFIITKYSEAIFLIKNYIKYE